MWLHADVVVGGCGGCPGCCFASRSPRAQRRSGPVGRLDSFTSVCYSCCCMRFWPARLRAPARATDAHPRRQDGALCAPCTHVRACLTLRRLLLCCCCLVPAQIRSPHRSNQSDDERSRGVRQSRARPYDAVVVVRAPLRRRRPDGVRAVLLPGRSSSADAKMTHAGD